MIDLKEARFNCDRMSQQKLAELSGVSRVTISNIENGRHELNIETARKIATVLGINWTECFE